MSFFILKHNKTLNFPSRLVFYDTETEEEDYNVDSYYAKKHSFKLGVSCYVELKNGIVERERWFIHENVNDFWNKLFSFTQTGKKVWVLALNQHFDFFVIAGFQVLLNNGWQLKTCICESNRFILKFQKQVRSKSCTLLFVDVANYTQHSVKSLGEVLGLPKLQIDFKNYNKEQLIEYCKRDVEIIKTFILKLIEFLKQNELGSFKATLPSIAFNVFKHKFMYNTIYIHKNKAAMQLERQGYYGGRNECFRLGRYTSDNYYLLDINSLYPYIMANYKLPSKLEFVTQNIDVNVLNSLMENKLVIAEVEVEIDKPVAPLKAKKLIFPVGSFKTTLCSPELKLVEAYGKVKNVFKAAVYDGKILFDKYVDYFYNQRLECKEKGDKVHELMSKIMLNSLYGKFAQRLREIVSLGEDYVPVEGSFILIEARTGKKYKAFRIGGSVYKIEVKDYARESFPAVAAFISSYARVILWSYFLIAGLENVYYCDTDSLIVNQAGYENLKEFIQPDKLGYLKIEQTGNFLEIRGCKDYTLGNMTKRKGIKKDAIAISNNVYVQPRWLKTKTMLSRGWLKDAYVETQVKTLSLNYDKGIVCEDGKVIPFRL